MEYNTIFGNLDFDTVRSGTFRDKLGRYIQLAKVIYNGRKYNFGSQDGAVTITNGFTLWKFIAPVGRWDMSHFANTPLRDALAEIVADTETMPIPAWDDFFAYLSEPSVEQMANMAIHGRCSSMRIAYRKLDLPLIQGCSTFAQFMCWLGENSGEAGDILSATFINGQDMIIPLDQYVGNPLRLMCRSAATERPDDYGTDTPVIQNGSTTIAAYGKKQGFYHDSVLYFAMGAIQGVYAFDVTSDQNGASIPKGWSVYSGGRYTATDFAADGAGITVTDSIAYTYLAKVFFNIEYESTEADVYRVRSVVDLSEVPDGVFAQAYNFSLGLDHTDTQPGLVLLTGASEDTQMMYVYVDQDDSFMGITLSAGWNKLDPQTLEATPYDMVANPLELSLVDGEFEITDIDAFSAATEYIETREQVMEELDGTIYFMLRA